jgi:hypothetical protein
MTEDGAKPESLLLDPAGQRKAYQLSTAVWKFVRG